MKKNERRLDYNRELQEFYQECQEIWHEQASMDEIAAFPRYSQKRELRIISKLASIW